MNDILEICRAYPTSESVNVGWLRSEYNCSVPATRDGKHNIFVDALQTGMLVLNIENEITVQIRFTMQQTRKRKINECNSIYELIITQL